MGSDDDVGTRGLGRTNDTSTSPESGPSRRRIRDAPQSHRGQRSTRVPTWARTARRGACAAWRARTLSGRAGRCSNISNRTTVTASASTLACRSETTWSSPAARSARSRRLRPMRTQRLLRSQARASTALGKTAERRRARFCHTMQRQSRRRDASWGKGIEEAEATLAASVSAVHIMDSEADDYALFCNSSRAPVDS